MSASTATRAHSEQGAAALGVVLVLLFSCAMFVLHASRARIVAERASANRRHAAEAFEAAEGGLQWTIAMLNERSAATHACAPADPSAGPSFRERVLGVNPAASAIQPIPAPSGAHGACVRLSAESRWRCGCAVDGASAVDGIPVTSAEEARIAASFTTRLSTGRAAGAVTIESTGCSGSARSCSARDNASTRPDAVARTAIDVAPLPALQALPDAPLVARGRIDLHGSAVELRTSDVSGLLAIAGGAILVDEAVRLVTLPGTPVQGAMLPDAGEFTHRGKLESVDAFLTRWLGMSQQHHASQPGNTHLPCSTVCTSADLAGAAADTNRRVLVVDGALLIDAPIELGTPDRPVIVVVGGSLSVRAALQSSGVWLARGVRWMAPAGQPSSLRGALISADDIVVTGAASFEHDGDVLARVAAIVGPFVPVPGSWRDFDD